MSAGPKGCIHCWRIPRLDQDKVWRGIEWAPMRRAYYRKSRGWKR